MNIRDWFTKDGSHYYINFLSDEQDADALKFALKQRGYKNVSKYIFDVPDLITYEPTAQEFFENTDIKDVLTSFGFTETPDLSVVSPWLLERTKSIEDLKNEDPKNRKIIVSVYNHNNDTQEGVDKVIKDLKKYYYQWFSDIWFPTIEKEFIEKYQAVVSEKEAAKAKRQKNLNKKVIGYLLTDSWQKPIRFYYLEEDAQSAKEPGYRIFRILEDGSITTEKGY